MSQDSENLIPERCPNPRPPIEYFAAFLDGELSADDWARIQDWLANHPEDAALVESHRNLLRCWRETAPAEPSEKVWRELFAQIVGQGLKIEDRGARAKDQNVRTGGRWIRIGLLGATAAAAAAVILALAAPRKDQGGNTPSAILRGSPRDTDGLNEDFSLAAAEDVDLVSMEETDTRLLVVGNPPVQEPLVLVATGDVTLVSIEPDEDGFVPHARMNPGSSAAPMIIAPLRSPETKDSSGK